MWKDARGLKVRRHQVRRNGEFGWVQGSGRGGTEAEFRDGRVEASFQGGVQLRVIAHGGVLVREVVGTLFMTPGVLLVRRFQREMPVPVDADHHPPVQSEAAARQDGEAEEEAGSSSKRHTLRCSS